jgi:hypothetical protein
MQFSTVTSAYQVGMSVFAAILALVVPCLSEGLPKEAKPLHKASVVIPEMARLAKVFAGDWNTVEIVQHGSSVPNGAGRRGIVHARLTGGGTALVSEGHSVGSVGGDLQWFITVWWDPHAKYYRFLTCFRTPTDGACELRGTAHWNGDTFVNDYEEVINGNRIKAQDVWTDITANSYTLTESHDVGKGVMKPYVVSHDTRQ